MCETNRNGSKTLFLRICLTFELKMFLFTMSQNLICLHLFCFVEEDFSDPSNESSDRSNKTGRDLVTDDDSLMVDKSKGTLWPGSDGDTCALASLHSLVVRLRQLLPGFVGLPRGRARRAGLPERGSGLRHQQGQRQPPSASLLDTFRHQWCVSDRLVDIITGAAPVV